MIEIGAVASEQTNLTLNPAAAAGSLGSSAASTDSGESLMSFDDFLDMINPLEHIPVVSSLYRAISGENINPVSHIVGDALYGGIFGLASAGLGALGALGNELLFSHPSQKPVSAPETMIAQQAEPSGTEGATATAPAPESAPMVAVAADLPLPAKGSQPMALASETGPAGNTGLPLDRSKQPYGGVMDTTLTQNAKQNQTLALTMVEQHRHLQTEHGLRKGRFDAPSAAPAATASAPAASLATQATPETQAALQSLLNDLRATKGIALYGNAASAAALPGSVVNVTK